MTALQKTVEAVETYGTKMQEFWMLRGERRLFMARRGLGNILGPLIFFK